ncbi:MAG: hypothetical protein RL637_314 [Pseudomonadota bacterium]
MSINITRQSQYGFILPLSLIILALLSGLALTLSQQARQQQQFILHQQQLWQIELRYRNILQQLVYQLITGKVQYSKVIGENFSLPIDNTPIYFDDIQVQIQDTAGLYGLSQFEPNSFQRLIENITANSILAHHISDELADWIDADDLPRRYGLERNQYIQLGKNYIPRNTMIRSADELLELPSITSELFNGNSTHLGLRNYIFSGSAPLNIATAPIPVLTAYLNIDHSRLNALITARIAQDWETVKRLLPAEFTMNEDSNPFIPSYDYRIQFSSQNHPSMRVFIRLTVDKNELYQILAWYYPDVIRGWE